MKPPPLYVVLLVFLPFLTIAQQNRPVATDAYMVTRMAEKFHTQPRPLDRTFSGQFFQQFLNELDGQYFLFLSEDRKRLESFRFQLDDQIRRQRTDFLDLVISIYQQRIRQADSLIDRMSSQPVNFALLDKVTAAEDSIAPLNLNGMRAKLAVLFGMAVRRGLREDLDSLKGSYSKHVSDSTEAVERIKVSNTFNRRINRLTQSPGGLSQALGLTYCNVLASCYDPHSSFFSVTEKEQFEQALGSRKFVFGFAMKEEGHGVVIDHLQPGSPAFRAGVFSEGDQIMSVQWEGKAPIDVKDAGLQEVDAIFDASNHDQVTITVKKADGTLRQVSLSKELSAGGDDETNRVKGLVLKGTQNIGYISLPAFYTDWDNSTDRNKGCAEDVAKEILELKKENITGLILDLRYNGGGSVDEAVDLAGLFIDAGPVAQIKSRDEKPYTLKDPNRGTVFDGPLILLVNGYSASASEVIAGTLQDYNRALIIGSPTYGKASGQIVLPLDTNIEMENAASMKPTDCFLKLTVMRLFRVNGTSVQRTGVHPDIMLPIPTDAVFHREADEPFALEATTIDANKYYKPYAPLPKEQMQLLAKGLLARPPAKGQASFTMAYPAYELKRLSADAVLKMENDQMEELLRGDTYLEVAFQVACHMTK